MQMAAGVAEHDPRRRFARDARNGNRDRLAWRQYRLEPLDPPLLPHALLGGHRHVEAVGLIDVVYQGGGVAAELRPMGGHGICAIELNSAIMHGVPKATTNEYVRRLGRHGSDNGERCCR